MRLRSSKHSKGSEGEEAESLAKDEGTHGEGHQQDSSAGLGPGVESEQQEDSKKPRQLKRTLILLLRDIVFAIIIVVIVLASVLVYTRVWPPMVVIESNSMQHGTSVSYLGVIDTGDLVLVQAAPERADVITWVEGKARGHLTYSNYGDVIIFNSDRGGTPIIHRPIIWLEYNVTTNKFDAPDLLQLDPSLWSGTYKNSTPVTTPYGLDGTLEISESGWKGSQLLIINIDTSFVSQASNHHSGYVTLGDNNMANYDNYLVRQEDIIGKARGELPWFGLIKLTIDPATGKCCRGWGDPYAPKNSWDALVVALILMITLPIIIDLAGMMINRMLRKRQERRKEKETGGEAAPPSKTDEQEIVEVETTTEEASSATEVEKPGAEGDDKEHIRNP